jgi:hypothetical protein
LIGYCDNFHILSCLFALSLSNQFQNVCSFDKPGNAHFSGAEAVLKNKLSDLLSETSRSTAPSLEVISLFIAVKDKLISDLKHE